MASPHLNALLCLRADMKVVVDGKDRTPRPLTFDLSQFRRDSQTTDEALSPVPEETGSSCSSIWKLPSPMEGPIEYPVSESRMARFKLDPSEASGSPTEDFPVKIRPPLKARPEIPARPPTPKIVIILRETETFMLAENVSLIAERDSEEGKRIVEDNRHHDYMTTGPGHRRYVKVAEAQTTYEVLKTKQLMAPLVGTDENGVQASTWDLYRTFSKES